MLTTKDRKRIRALQNSFLESQALIEWEAEFGSFKPLWTKPTLGPTVHQLRLAIYTQHEERIRRIAEGREALSRGEA